MFSGCGYFLLPEEESLETWLVPDLEPLRERRVQTLVKFKLAVDVNGSGRDVQKDTVSLTDFDLEVAEDEDENDS